MNESGSCPASEHQGIASLDSIYIYILIATNIAATILIFIANVVVIYVLKTTDQLRNFSTKLILYLSISDIGVAVISQNLFTVLLFRYKEESCLLHSFEQFCALFSIHLSGSIIGLISVDRSLRIKYLIRYQVAVNNRSATGLVILAVIVATLQATLIHLGNIVHKAFKITALTIDSLLAVGVITLYVLSSRAVKKQTQNVAKQDASKSFSKVANRISISLIVIFTPYMIIKVLKSFYSNYWTTFSFLVAIIITFLNSFVNAWIFLTANSRSRQKIANLFHLSTSNRNSVSKDQHERTISAAC